MDSSDLSIPSLQNKIESIISFLSEHKSILNVHMTEAYLNNSLSLIPSSWFDSLMPHDYTSYLTLPSLIQAVHLSTPKNDSFLQFLLTSSSLSPNFPQYTSELPISFKESSGMTPKKIHETSRLASFISEKFHEQNLSKIIDLGAGQGYLSFLLSSRCGFLVTAIEGRKYNSEQSEKRAEKLMKVVKGENLLRNVCEIVKGDDLDLYTGEECGIVGLHTCGDLASDSLKMFVSSKNVKGIVNVGCCYQLLSEFVYKDSQAFKEYVERVGESADGRSLDESLVDDKDKAGYPLSNFVRENFPGFLLGKLNRSLCIGDSSAQNSQKAIFNFRKMEYRSAFQYILSTQYPHLSKVFAIGNKIRRFKDFSEYCEAAFKRLKLPNPLNSEELNNIYQQHFEQDSKKISILWAIRSVFSGPIENLIILDRLLYLKEQGISAEAFTIFNREQSPRNTVICAFKLH